MPLEGSPRKIGLIFALNNILITVQRITNVNAVMIKVLKLKKGVYAIVLGMIALVVYGLTGKGNPEEGTYLVQIAGACFLLGALLFLLPIIMAKKDSKGEVQLDPEKRLVEAAETEAEASQTP